MKKLWIMYLLMFVGMVLGGCHESTVGYLITKDASYNPDSIVIRLTPDPSLDAMRIESKAPWVSLRMEGYVGTEPISFSIDDVSSTAGDEAALLFKEDVYIRGGGVLLYPFEPKNKIPAGRYTVSVRVTNEDWSEVVMDALTFVVKP